MLKYEEIVQNDLVLVDKNFRDNSKSSFLEAVVW